MAPTARTASGSARSRLILTVTRACDARCSYCPVVKSAQALAPDDAILALRMFAERWGGGDVKLFGGEPLLEPSVVRAVVDAVQDDPRLLRVQIGTNGLHLDRGWLDWLGRRSKAQIQVSIDGPPALHARHRPAPDPPGWEPLWRLLPDLARARRVAVAMTIPPESAALAAGSFDHLLGLGFRRLTLLPGYMLPWSRDRLTELRASFGQIRTRLEAGWRAGERLTLRNLFVRSPVPLFDPGILVDADRSIHTGNAALAAGLGSLPEATRVGDLDHPPAPDLVAARARDLPALLEAALPPHVWRSMLAVDAELARLCLSLLPAWAAWRKRGRRAAVAEDGVGEAKAGHGAGEEPEAAAGEVAR